VSQGDSQGGKPEETLDEFAARMVREAWALTRQQVYRWAYEPYLVSDPQKPGKEKT